MNPGDRPRKKILTAVGAVVAAAAVTGLTLVVDSAPAAADELERFASCEALAAWGEGADATNGARTREATADVATGTPGSSGTTGGGEGGSDAAAAPSSAPLASEGSSQQLALTDDDGTNVVVEGVDELDVVDQIDAGHVLVVAAARLSIIDLVDDAVVANLPVDSSVQATFDRDRGIAWVVGPDDETGRLVVRRIAVTATSLAEQATWSTDGWLVDARRVGDRLHVVAADGYDVMPTDVMPTDDVGAPAEDGTVPFSSGPVPCDQVLHPMDPSDSTATLLVTLPAEGELEPVHAAEVVGSGEQVHVTTDAAYLATPLYGDRIETSIHRFDLDDLELTGSGRVEGTLLNEFSMSEHEGHLRVAVTDGGGFGRAIDGDVAVDVPSGAALPSEAAPVAPALNEVVVLDTDGALDVVGRTPRFGHPGETLHGIRFDGDVAYAVTFLQTDPFYVLDLATPSAPRVEGEVELPGFSSYLHPVGDGLVAGFGPGDDGKTAVKLFDVSDRSQPRVVDTLTLGDESPILWDHHAFVDLGDGRFAVPASTYRQQTPAGCTQQRQDELRAAEARLNGEMEVLWSGGEPSASEQARLDELNSEASEIYSDGCLYPSALPESSVVVVDTSGGHLELVQRVGAVLQPTSATRVVTTDDGWGLLAGNHWVVVDGASGDQTADLELGPEGVGGPGGRGIVID